MKRILKAIPAALLAAVRNPRPQPQANGAQEVKNPASNAVREPKK